MMNHKEPIKQLHRNRFQAQATSANRHTGQHHQVRRLLAKSRAPDNNHVATSAGQGQRLMAPTKMAMEQLFRQDFSNVKLFPQSAKARELGANAYTQGAEIHFAPGRYNPHSPVGQSLIAHELTHVVQQARSAVRPTTRHHDSLINADTRLEREADRMGKQAAASSRYDKAATGYATDSARLKPLFPSARIIQKDDDDSGGFDVDFSILPPSLQFRLWVLSLDANTSRVRLSRDFGDVTTGLNYSYGGALSADVRAGGFRGSVGIDPTDANLSFGAAYQGTGFGARGSFGIDPNNPSDASLSLGGSYRGFNFGASGNFGERRLGFNLGYGAPLLPFPAELRSTFMAGAQGLGNMAGNIGSVMDDPLAWYNLHSDDISTISSAISTGRRIHRQQTSSQRFGAGLRLSYSPSGGLLIYGGAQIMFGGL